MPEAVISDRLDCPIKLLFATAYSHEGEFLFGGKNKN
jgi:hypothetical protein